MVADTSEKGQHPSTLLAVAVSIFDGSTKTAPVEITSLADVLERIRNGTYRQYVEHLRRLLAIQGEAAYTKAKRRSIAFTPAGVFQVRANAKLATPSGLLNFDFDHPPDLTEAKARLREDPYVVYVFDSPSDDGLKVSVWADGIVNDATYKHAWAAVLAYFERTYPGLAVANDKACKDISRLCYMSFDPDMYVNPEAQRYSVPTYEPPPQHQQRQRASAPHTGGRQDTTAQRALETATKMIDASIPSTSTSPGTRHETRLKAARLLGGYMAGGILSYDQAYSALQEAVARNTNDLPGSMKTIADGLRNGASEPITLDALEAERLDWLKTHANNSRNGHQAPAPDVPPKDTESQDASSSLRSWKVRLLRNKSDIAQQTINNFILAIQHLDPWKSQGCWYDSVREAHMVGTERVKEGDDTAAGVLIERATQIRVTNLALAGRALDYVCRQKTRDLLQEWVDTLPVVDVSDLLTTWLRRYANVPDTVSDAYVGDISRIIPVSMIARILRPGCQYRYVPILEGQEDIGKSKLTKALAGHDSFGRSWHVALSAGLESKEAHMMLDGALIAELEELSSYTKTDENRMKALITAEVDSFVPKFANKRVDHPRRTIFIATVNPEGDGAYLKGQAGNTRFLPITVGTINIVGFLAVRTQLFAEAKAYYLAHQEDWWKLNGEEDATNEREDRRQTSVYEGQQLQNWLNRLQPAQCVWQDVAELHLKISKDRWNRALQMEIGKALRAHGWRPQRTESKRFWAPG